MLRQRLLQIRDLIDECDYLFATLPNLPPLFSFLVGTFHQYQWFAPKALAWLDAFEELADHKGGQFLIEWDEFVAVGDKRIEPRAVINEEDFMREYTFDVIVNPDMMEDLVEAKR